MNTVGEQLTAARKERKLSRQQVADLTGLTVAKIANIEKGRELKDAEANVITAFLGAGAQTPPGQVTPPDPVGGVQLDRKSVV